MRIMSSKYSSSDGGQSSCGAVSMHTTCIETGSYPVMVLDAATAGEAPACASGSMFAARLSGAAAGELFSHSELAQKWAHLDKSGIRLCR